MGFERGEDASPAGTAFGDAVNALSVPVNPQPSEKKPFTFSPPSNAPSPAAASVGFALPVVSAQQPQSAFQQPQIQPLMSIQLPSPAFQQPQVQPLMSIQLQQPPINQAWMQQNPGTSGPSDEHPSLSLSELEQFKSEKFSFGRIPHTPPSKEFR